jgi:hypothetical protein
MLVSLRTTLRSLDIMSRTRTIPAIFAFSPTMLVDQLLLSCYLVFRA